MFEVLQEHGGNSSNDDNTTVGTNNYGAISNWWDININENNDLSSSPAQHIHHNNYAVVDEEWGIEHPEFLKPNRRVSWSVAEKEFIRDWLDNNDGFTKNRATQLLKHIRENKSVHKIFHLNHIVDSTRLRHGIRSIEEGEKRKSVIYYSEI